MRAIDGRAGLAFVGAMLCGSCGLGTAGAVAGASGGGPGGSNAPPSISGFAVLGPKEPPAMLRFVLADAEGDPAFVELLFAVPGEPPRRLSQVGGLPANPYSFAAEPGGTEHALSWDFAAEPLLPDDASFVDGVRVYALVENGLQEVVLGANGAEVGLGNDAPSAQVQTPAGEVDGVVPVRFTIADSSGDLLDVRIEFDVVGDVPDVAWRVARPAGLKVGEPTPEHAFQGVSAPAAGTQLVFFWDTDHDLPQLERDVRVRVTPTDPVVEGAPSESAPFRVDNDAEPIVFLEEIGFQLNPDRQRGIPVPYRLVDDGGEALVVFQWRRAPEGFPDLPADPAALEAALADPEQRRALRICSEFPRIEEGRTLPVDATRVALPELADELAQLAAGGIVGRTLELLRAPAQRTMLPAGRASSPLVAPVAALPLGDGLEALVLDATTPGSWRLVEIGIATGSLLRELASGPGTPSALAKSFADDAVLVASDVAGSWSLDRVRLADGAIERLFDADGALDGGPVRGIASVGRGSTLVTVGDSLVQVRHDGAGPARGLVLLEGLATPWGLVLDPSTRATAYVAERDAPTPAGTGRVIALDLRTRARRALVARPPAGTPPLGSPRGLALRPGGTRLFATCEDGVLRALDLAGGGVGTCFPLAEGLDPAGALSAGADGLLLVAAPSGLAAIGGLEQRRVIVAHDPRGNVVEVDRAFEPAHLAPRRWRLRRERVRGSPDGTRTSFLWDCRDAGGGEVFLRATPYDTERGVASATVAPRGVDAPFVEVPITGGPGFPSRLFDVALVDVDGDGDLDLASADDGASLLSILVQSGRGAFADPPIELASAQVSGPRSLVAVDLDGDGDVDLASANYNSHNLAVWLRDGRGGFASEPLLLGGAQLTRRARGLAAADLDGDGLLDLVSANLQSNDLTIFFQRSPGVFDPLPLALADGAATAASRCVATADLDGDGDVDVVGGSEGGNLAVFFQIAPGAFSPRALVLGRTEVSERVSEIVPADVDGDGDLDLVSANQGSGNVTIFTQTAPGEFDPVPRVLAPTGFATGSVQFGLEVVDLDGDGVLDVVAAMESRRLVAWYLAGDGSVRLGPVTLPASGSTLSVAAADVDHDGLLDLVCTKDPSSRPDLLWAVGPLRHASLVPGLQVPNSNGETRQADIDGDGLLDLVAPGSGAGQAIAIVHFQAFPRRFEESPLLLGSAGNSTPTLLVADLDADSRLDVAHPYVNFSPAIPAHAFWQEGTGLFTAMEIPALNGLFLPVFLARDLDRDGDLDLITRNALSLLVLENVASREFARGAISIPNSSFGVAAEVADIDGDGWQDAAYLRGFSPDYGYCLRVHYQRGPLDFEPDASELLCSFDLLPFVALEDMDADGDLDLATAFQAPRRVHVLRQVGSRTFEPWRTDLEDASLATPRFVDLDGDGDLDVLIPRARRAYLQVAPGVFDPEPVVFDLSQGPFWAGIQDLDGDGDRDLLFGGPSNQLLVSYGGG